MRKHLILCTNIVLSVLGFTLLAWGQKPSMRIPRLPPRPLMPPPYGALDGYRHRVIISTDLGGSDLSDIQSMIYYLLYADLFDTEGLISSPPQKGRKKDILKVIYYYDRDFPVLKIRSRNYPSPDHLRIITKQGAIRPAPDAGYSQSTEGSDWIIQCAARNDPRPLYVLVWGSITDVAQALHDEPWIEDKLRIYFIADQNLKTDRFAFQYIEQNHPNLWMIINHSTYRGWYKGGYQEGDYDNRTFVREHIRDHGALGDYFAIWKNGSIRMADACSVAYLLHNNPDSPTSQSWGGQFVPHPHNPQWWTDDPDRELREAGYRGAKTINIWRTSYLSDLQSRMDRCLKPTIRRRKWKPKDDYRISAH